ncbi:hypothetical protein WICPIJ_001399 [Wickerhamomyces pijperi]|uniref:Uncharacterized protein n=1 Tax=Wickerhamomyces pijperi TaxID=599730 RepID=A0A9P8TQT1_WICPI|nr:hypothetical protein WICPIJ_001399 [Wickerhamomyces pijperi]
MASEYFSTASSNCFCLMAKLPSIFNWSALALVSGSTSTAASVVTGTEVASPDLALLRISFKDKPLN